MFHLVETKHLVCNMPVGVVFERAGFFTVEGVTFPGKFLGHVERGPNLPIDDLDIIDQWRQLQEFAASTARK